MRAHGHAARYNIRRRRHPALPDKMQYVVKGSFDINICSLLPILGKPRGHQDSLQISKNGCGYARQGALHGKKLRGAHAPGAPPVPTPMQHVKVDAEIAREGQGMACSPNITTTAQRALAMEMPKERGLSASTCGCS